MRANWRQFLVLSLAAGALCFASTARAQTYVDPKSPVVKKYLQVDNFGHVQKVTSEEYKMVMTSGGNTCSNNLLECPIGIDAVQGKADPKYKDIFKDLAGIGKKDGKRVWMFGNKAIDVFPMGLVLWNPDEALALLTKKLEKPEVVEFMARGKENIYEALWYLGDAAAFDAMLKHFHSLGYTDMHTKDGLMRIYTWPLKDEQKKQVEDFCIKMFQNTGALPAGQGREKEIVKPCLRYLGLTASKNNDAIEFVENLLGSTAADAARALGGMDYKKAKPALAELLSKQKRDKTSGKKKVTIWSPRDESVAAAVALLGMGDADAAKAIKSWIEVNKKDKRLEDSSGFEMTFFEAPWASEASKKKLLPMLSKAYKDALALSKSENNVKLYAVRAAIALAQCGQKDGLPLLQEVLNGSDKDQREEVLIGLGGHTNYWGTFRTGLGGIMMGGKKGIGKKDVEELEAIILKRLKFWSERGAKEKAMRAVLDMRSRVKAAGL